MKTKVSKHALTFILVLCMAVSVFTVAMAEEVDSTAVAWDEYTQDELTELGEETPSMDGYLFGGWYTKESATHEEEVANHLASATIPEGADSIYAKFVPKAVLGVRAQLSSEDMNQIVATAEGENVDAALRFVTSVDSLLYKAVGFDVVYIKDGETQTKNVESSAVYKQLFGTDGSGKVSNEYVPNTTFSKESEYFKACTVEAVGADYCDVLMSITPYWVTMDGTKVCGDTVEKNVSSGMTRLSNIYVSATGADGINTGAKASPVATLSHAMYRTDATANIIVMDDIEANTTATVQDGKNITVKNDEGADVTIYRGETLTAASMFDVAQGNTLTVEGLTLDGRTVAEKDEDATVEGYIDTVTSSSVSLIANQGTVNLKNIVGQYAVKTASHGAVLQSYGSTDVVKVEGSTFRNNKSAGQGGAIRMGGSTKYLEVKNSIFENNYATENGGALVSHSDTVLITDCSFTNNESGTNGGAFYSGTSSIVTMEVSGDKGVNQALFSGNTAAYGGAVSNGSGTIEVTGYTFQNNSTSAETGTGGAIFTSTATIKANDCKFQGNSAYRGGAIYSGSKGTINVQGDLKSAMSIFTGNTAEDYGGAIAMGTGWLTVDGYNFTGNSAKTGGAIHHNASSQTGTITNSVFTSNTSTSQGGAVWSQANSMQITGCGFTTNESPNGGALYVGANATTTEVKNSDFSENGATIADGGAIYSEDNITIMGCDFEKNTSEKIGGAVRLANTATASTISGCTFTSNESTTSVGGAVALYGSKVATCIHSVSDCTFTTNTAYTQGGGLYCNTITVNVTDCSFNTNTAKKSGGGAYVAGGSAATFTDTAGTAKNTFTGNQATSEAAVEYGGGAICVGSGSLIIDGYTFTNNKAISAVGGAIANRGSKLELKNTVWFEGNQGTNGGAIHMNSGTGTLTIASGTITIKGNTATGHGGGIYKSGALNITGGTINLEGNTTTNNGGAICNNNGTMTVTGGTMTLTDNTANYGGGIYVNNSSVSLTGANVTFTENTANTYGGAIYSKDTYVDSDESGKKNGTEDAENVIKVQLNGVKFVDNTADAGGAICNFEEVTAESCSFTGNSATAGEGGAIYSNEVANLTGCTFGTSSASSNGGAICVAAGTTSINNGIFNQNTAVTGGAIYQATGTLNINGGTYGQNTATTGGGGAIYHKAGTLNINQGTTNKTTFDGNTTTYWGGAVYTNDGTFKANLCDFMNNSASYGGAILMSSSSTVSNSTFTSNIATANEGGACYIDVDSTLDNCSFDGNKAKTNGWALSVGANVTLKGTGSFTNNTKTDNSTVAGNAGAIFLWQNNKTFQGDTEATYSYTFEQNEFYDIFIKANKTHDLVLEGDYSSNDTAE